MPSTIRNVNSFKLKDNSKSGKTKMEVKGNMVNFNNN